MTKSEARSLWKGLPTPSLYRGCIEGNATVREPYRARAYYAIG